VQEYPESLQVADSSGRKPIDRPSGGDPPLQDIVVWLESAMAGGVAFEPLSSPQPLVQPANPPYFPDKETLVHPIAIDPPVSSQQPSPSLHLVTSSSFEQKTSSQTPSLAASLTANALPSEENTNMMQSHMNSTKNTEGADFAANSAQFGEEVSTEDRSEEGAADLKRMREEMEVLMELVNQVTAERPRSDNEEDSTKLSALVSHFGELNTLAHEKRLSVDENKERDAIRSSKEHYDFHVMFVQKMRCMVAACETGASGMVACENGQSFKSVAMQMVQEQSLGALKKAKIGALVAETIKWCNKQVHIPFMDAVGPVIQTLATLKEERDKFLGVARVADFATIAAMVEDTDGVHRAIERTARHLIRSRLFVGTKEDSGERRQRLLKLMALRAVRDPKQKRVFLPT
jgi:hypothetical protein